MQETNGCGLYLLKIWCKSFFFRVTEDARDQWVCSSDYFLELTDNHLRDGSIPLTHAMYGNIKRDHMALLGTLGSSSDLKTAIKFYKVIRFLSYQVPNGK